METGHALSFPGLWHESVSGNRDMAGGSSLMLNWQPSAASRLMAIWLHVRKGSKPRWRINLVYDERMAKDFHSYVQHTSLVLFYEPFALSSKYFLQTTSFRNAFSICCLHGLVFCSISFNAEIVLLHVFQNSVQLYSFKCEIRPL